jgi:hypothetical protein
VHTHADLKRTDLFELWRKLRLKHGQVTRLMYYALWGAREDCHWNKISLAEKARFDAQLTSVVPRKKARGSGRE